MNSYTEIDDTISFKTPSKLSRAGTNKESTSSAKNSGEADDSQFVLSEVVRDLNNRNERMANELTASNHNCL